MLLLELVDLFPYELGLLHLLLDLVLITLIHSDLIIEFGPNLIEKLIETRRRILRHAAISRVHGHVGGCSARPCADSLRNDETGRGD